MSLSKVPLSNHFFLLAEQTLPVSIVSTFATMLQNFVLNAIPLLTLGCHLRPEGLQGQSLLLKFNTCVSSRPECPRLFTAEPSDPLIALSIICAPGKLSGSACTWLTSRASSSGSLLSLCWFFSFLTSETRLRPLPLPLPLVFLSFPLSDRWPESHVEYPYQSSSHDVSAYPCPCCFQVWYSCSS